MPPSREQLVEREARPGRRLDEAGDDQAARVDPRRLELGSRDAVAPGHRVGQDDHLAGVGGVGEDLAPPGRGGREDEVAIGGKTAAVERSGEDVAALERQEAREARCRRLASGAAVGAAWGTALGIGLLSGITVPALKDGRSLADPGLPGRSRIGADELDDDARHPPTADHARRPPPARAHHAGLAGRRARRRRCRADRARGADRVQRSVDAGAVHAPDRGGAPRRDGPGIGARVPSRCSSTSSSGRRGCRCTPRLRVAASTSSVRPAAISSGSSSPPPSSDGSRRRAGTGRSARRPA